MKKMTCRQLGGGCDHEFVAASWEEMSALSNKHGKEMIQAGDQAHLEAMHKMREIMQKGEMQAWYENKQKEFEALPEIG